MNTVTLESIIDYIHSCHDSQMHISMCAEVTSCENVVEDAKAFAPVYHYGGYITFTDAAICMSEPGTTNYRSMSNVTDIRNGTYVVIKDEDKFTLELVAPINECYKAKSKGDVSSGFRNAIIMQRLDETVYNLLDTDGSLNSIIESDKASESDLIFKASVEVAYLGNNECVVWTVTLDAEEKLLSELLIEEINNV